MQNCSLAITRSREKLSLNPDARPHSRSPDGEYDQTSPVSVQCPPGGMYIDTAAPAVGLSVCGYSMQLFESAAAVESENPPERSLDRDSESEPPLLPSC